MSDIDFGVKALVGVGRLHYYTSLKMTTHLASTCRPTELLLSEKENQI